MGSLLENNDTLQITTEQGFPVELNLEEYFAGHLKKEEFEGKVFEFQNKPRKKNFHDPPVRNFLAENRNGKWIYWGLIHVFDTVYDYRSNTTSGKFKIIYLYTPEVMRMVHQIIDRNPDTDYFR